MNPGGLSEAYRGDVEITTAPDIAGYIEQYGDELDATTMEYLCKKLLMVGVAFGPQESGGVADASLSLNATSAAATLVQTSEVETPEYNDNVRTLDKYALSPDGKFIVWYTESGIDAVTSEQAEQIGVEMEALVAAEEALLGVTWEYEANYISFSKGVDIDKLDPDDYEAFGKAMPVFLIESSTGEGGALAYYFNTATALEKFAAFVGTTGWIDDTGILPSIYSWPFVGIQPSALQKPQDLSFILAHELTHHFQSVMGATNRDNITRETTANLVAATVVSTNSTDTIGNLHAQWYIENTRTSIDKGLHTGGYSTFLFAKAYVDVVNNSWTHMMESFKQDDAFGYLVQQAGSQYREVWETLAVRNITKAYSEKSFLPQGMPKPTLTLTPICSQQITLDYSAIDYYYIPLGEARSKEMIVFINPGLAEMGTLSYCLMGGKNGNYTPLGSALIGAEETTIETASDSYKAYDELVLAVVNSSTTQAVNYTVGSITRPLLALSNNDMHGMMMVGEDSLYMELEIDSFLQTMIDLFLLFNALDTDTGSAELNTVLRYYIDAANEAAGELQAA